MKILIKIKGGMLLCFLLFIGSYSIQSQNVLDILNKAQAKIEGKSSLSCDLKYKMYTSYSADKPSELMEGKMIRNNKVQFTQIHETIFYTNPNTNRYIKLNKEEKALQFVESDEIKAQHDTGNFLEIFIKLFKNTELIDKGNEWLCVLNSDKITQIPFGRIEIYIDKKSSLLTKQTIYYLIHQKVIDAEGNESFQNPKLEMEFTNYRTELSSEELNLLDSSNYVKIVDDHIIPTGNYTGYQIFEEIN